MPELNFMAWTSLAPRLRMAAMMPHDLPAVVLTPTATVGDDRRARKLAFRQQTAQARAQRAGRPNADSGPVLTPPVASSVPASPRAAGPITPQKPATPARPIETAAQREERDYARFYPQASAPDLAAGLTAAEAAEAERLFPTAPPDLSKGMTEAEQATYAKMFPSGSPTDPDAGMSPSELAEYRRIYPTDRPPDGLTASETAAYARLFGDEE